MSPALTFGWYIWTRHRFALTLCASCWLAAMIFCHALPDSFFRTAPEESFRLAWIMVGLYFSLCVCLVIVFGCLLMIFSFSREVRLELRESGFPNRLWHLPLPTRALVFWPMLWGSAAMILAWLPLAWAARRPWGVEIPLGWPGLLLAVVLAWLQAIVWTPFPLPWVRAILLIPLSCVLIVTPSVVLELGISPIVVCVLLAALLSAAYGLAIRGVARARCGDNVQWCWPAWLRWRRAATPIRPPFGSAAQAQLWFEWRQGGLAFPVAVAAYSLFILPIVISSFLREKENGNSWLGLASVLLICVLGLAVTCGAVIGSLSGRQQTRALSSFLATRPLSIRSLVRAKFKTAALSTLAGWAILWVGLPICMVLGGHAETMRQHLSDGRFWASLVLLAGGVLILAWAQMAGNLWSGLTPPARIVKFALVSPIYLFLICVGLITMQQPKLRPTFAALLPWLASGAIVLKCLVAAWSLSRLKRNALVPSHVLIGALVAWCTVAIGLLALSRWLIPSNVVPVSGLVLGIVLLLPLTRLALAPLVLAWNRHR